MPLKPPKTRLNPKAARSVKKRAAPTTIARHSTSYIVTVIGEVLRSTSLDVLDVLITLAISSSSVPPQPLPRRRRANGRPAPVDPPRGISRNAVSRSLNVPLETVRRRVSALLEKKVIQERRHGLVVPEVCPLGALDNTAELLALNAQTVRQLFLNLKAQGVRLD